MKTLLLIIGSIAILKVIYDIYKTLSNKRLVDKIMRESIERFCQNNPEEYRYIKELRNKYYSEMRYSGHLGSTRDGGEDDRQENIKQYKKVKVLEAQLLRRVELAHFERTVSEVMRKYGCDEKLSVLLMNRQSGYYSGYEFTLLDKYDIGFKTTPADRVLKGWV